MLKQLKRDPQASLPIEEAHLAASQSRVRLKRVEEALGKRTEDLAVTNRQLRRGVKRHKTMQDTARKNGQHFKKCLEESLELQKRLRQLTQMVGGSFSVESAPGQGTTIIARIPLGKVVRTKS